MWKDSICTSKAIWSRTFSMMGKIIIKKKKKIKGKEKDINKNRKGTKLDQQRSH